MLQKQSLNILCRIYQLFLEVYNFSLHIAVFHIRLSSFVFVTFCLHVRVGCFIIVHSVQRTSVQLSSVDQVNLILKMAGSSFPPIFKNQYEISKPLLNLYISYIVIHVYIKTLCCVYDHSLSCIWSYAVFQNVSF